MDTLYHIMPIVAAVLFLSAAVAAVHRPTVKWVLPAITSLTFLAWSAHAMIVGGQTGFWVEHTRNAWGNQIWFDLLIGVAVAWTLLVPRAKAVGMPPWPWLALVAATGGIGLTAMFARCCYLESRAV